MLGEEAEQLISMLERLEKAGTLQNFLKNAPEVPLEDRWRDALVPSVSDGFEKMHNHCMVNLSLFLKQMEDAMAWANHYADYCRNLYDSYHAYREQIKNPDILKFMKDYEEYYMKKEEE